MAIEARALRRETIDRLLTRYGNQRRLPKFGIEPHPLGELKSAQGRHPEITEHHVGMPAFELLEALESTGRQVYLGPHRGQKLA